VSHSFSASGDMQTTVVLSYVRTMPEYLKLIITGASDQNLSSELNEDFDVGPTEVIAEVAQVFQVYGTAEDFYQKVFYPDVSKGTPLVFDVDEFLTLEDVNNRTVLAEATTEENVNSWTPDKGLYTRPTKDFQAYFTSYDAAMTFVSRPVATLQQTIELRHGKTLSEILKDKKGEVQGPLDTFTSGIKSARFYSRIYNLVQPGPALDFAAIQAITNTGSSDGVATEGSWQIIAAEHNIPESRQNWDQVLIKYRNAVRGKTSVALL